jgi:hypothetical protein
MQSPKSFEELEAAGFSVKPGIIAGQRCYLVTPKLATNPDLWNADTLIYRSSIWTKGGELVSGSFPKFFNLNEASDVVRDPIDSDFSDMKIVEKMDGSTLICSKVQGQLIHRTRGTFNAEILPNGSEISILKKKYPLAFDNFWLDHGVSLLFEWTTPSNKIIIDYGSEPELSLIGAISHSDYSLYLQKDLDYIAKQINVPRPKVYLFSNMNELVNSVQAFKGAEGVVVYFDNDQKLKKIKGLEYLKLHRFKSNATLKNITEMFFEHEFNSAEEYRKYIKETFDYECFMMVEAYIFKVWTYYIKAQDIISDLVFETIPLRELSRKDAAMRILANHKDDGLSGYCFELLDGKKIQVDKVKKLVYNLMEKYNEFEKENIICEKLNSEE